MKCRRIHTSTSSEDAVRGVDESLQDDGFIEPRRAERGRVVSRSAFGDEFNFSSASG
jgi:hypothetical protein